MKTKKEIHNLLIKYIHRELSDEERIFVEKWISQNESNKKYFDDLYKADLALKLTIQKNWIKESSHKSSIKRYLNHFIRIAVVLVIIISSGIYLFNSKQEKDIVKNLVLSPGKSTATLSLSSGEVISLDTMSGILKEKDGTSISINNKGEIKYSGTNIIAKENINNILNVPNGGEYKLKLSDGTIVWMNSDSRLEYPSNFSGETRLVKLYGEAYFKVAKSKKQFIVQINDLKIAVYGTEFNINTYGDKIETVLVSGSVSLVTPQQEIKLHPEEMGKFDKKNQAINISKVNTDYYTAWRKGLFIFKNEPIHSIVEKISKWYNIKNINIDENIKDTRLSGVMEKYKDANDLFIYFEKTSDLKFRIDNDKNLYISNK